jgi:hypothetical protein
MPPACSGWMAAAYQLDFERETRVGVFPGGTSANVIPAGYLRDDLTP